MNSGHYTLVYTTYKIILDALSEVLVLVKLKKRSNSYKPLFA
jgi:hypothetical protein